MRLTEMQREALRVLGREHPHAVPETMLRDEFDARRPRLIANGLERHGLVRFGRYHGGLDDQCGYDLHLTDLGIRVAEQQGGGQHG